METGLVAKVIVGILSTLLYTKRMLKIPGLLASKVING
jgi:hypothetical protein